MITAPPLAHPDYTGPEKPRLHDALAKRLLGHVWTTPALQEESVVWLAVGCKSCVRPEHSAVKRALASLRRKGLVTGEQVFKLDEHGRKLFTLSQHPRGYAQRFCLWAMAPLSTLHDSEMAAGESLFGG